MHPPPSRLHLLQRLLNARNMVRRQHPHLGREIRVGCSRNSLGLAHLDKGAVELAAAAREHVQPVVALQDARRQRGGGRVGRRPAQHGRVEGNDAGEVGAGDFEPADAADGGEGAGGGGGGVLGWGLVMGRGGGGLVGLALHSSEAMMSGVEVLELDQVMIGCEVIGERRSTLKG